MTKTHGLIGVGIGQIANRESVIHSTSLRQDGRRSPAVQEIVCLKMLPTSYHAPGYCRIYSLYA